MYASATQPKAQPVDNRTALLMTTAVTTHLDKRFVDERNNIFVQVILVAEKGTCSFEY